MIQWFPGHMNAAKKKAAETMEFTDVVVEVLDARVPEASSNPMIRELRLHRQRPACGYSIRPTWLIRKQRRPGSITTTSRTA